MEQTKKVNGVEYSDSAYCTCNHILAVHGTDGKVCCACFGSEAYHQFEPRDKK